MSDNREKRRIRRKNHIAKDLRTPKFRPRVVADRSKYEDEQERRWRRYHQVADAALEVEDEEE